MNKNICFKLSINLEKITNKYSKIVIEIKKGVFNLLKPIQIDQYHNQPFFGPNKQSLVKIELIECWLINTSQRLKIVMGE